MSHTQPAPVLYGRHNLHELVWPDTPDGRYVQPLLLALIQQGTLAYIDNIDAEVQVLKWGDLLFLLAVAKPLAQVKKGVLQHVL